MTIPPRLCASGSLACSGLLPCQACYAKISTEVIPRAMVAANLNSDHETAERFFLAWRNAWTDMLRAMPSPEVPPTLNAAPSEPPAVEDDPEFAPTVPCAECGKAIDSTQLDMTLDGILPVCSVVCAGRHAQKNDRSHGEQQIEAGAASARRKKPRKAKRSEDEPTETKKEEPHDPTS